MTATVHLRPGGILRPFWNILQKGLEASTMSKFWRSHPQIQHYARIVDRNQSCGVQELCEIRLSNRIKLATVYLLSRPCNGCLPMVMSRKVSWSDVRAFLTFWTKVQKDFHNGEYVEGGKIIQTEKGRKAWTKYTRSFSHGDALMYSEYAVRLWYNIIPQLYRSCPPTEKRPTTDWY